MVPSSVYSMILIITKDNTQHHRQQLYITLYIQQLNIYNYIYKNTSYSKRRSAHFHAHINIYTVIEVAFVHS